MKSKGRFSFGRWCIENKLYFLAFILPVLSMLIVYLFKGVFPFGDEMYLRSDCYHQYTPYLQMLQDKLRDGGSLFYTWEIGSGMNFMAIISYYLASPLNLLTIIWPGKIADLVSFFIIVKMGLSGFSATYYLSKRFGHHNVATVVFGMVYALSSYFVAFNWNIMWLDCMWLMPFVILGLDKLVRERKCKMYCISLGLCIFSNYYIGIMLCIYSVIYFIYLICTADVDTTPGKIRARLIICRDYILYSLLAGGMAACVILPEYFSLLISKSAESSFPSSLENYFSVLYMLFRSLICIPVADLKYSHDPNIYCTMAVFILIPLFFMCKKIRKKDRIGKSVIMIVMLLSFSFNIPNYIWHGLHFPNSLPCRESFLYIFLIITMAYEAFIHIREFKTVQVVGTAVGALGLVMIFEEMFSDAEFFSDLVVDTDMLKIAYFSMLFIALYAVLICWYRSKPHLKSFLSYIMVLAVFCELTLNMSVTGIASTSSRDGYYDDTDAYAQLNDTAKADADEEGIYFYRTENATHSTRNDGARFGYNSISTFSSVSTAAMQYYYDDMGMQTSFNAYSSYGMTPLTASLFSIKYEYSSSDPTIPASASLVDSLTYDKSNGSSTLKLYEYSNTLPLGFMINASAMSSWDTSSGNPFVTQNNFISSAVNGGSPVFHKLKTTSLGTFTAEYDLDSNDTYVVTGDEDVFDVYFFCNTSAENLTATITENDGSTSTKSFSATNQEYICHVGEVAPGTSITVTTGDSNSLSTCYAYAFDYDAWDIDYSLLSANTYNVDTFEDTEISGTIDVETSGIMYTSIVYDGGWSVYVDGKKTKPTSICDDALTGVFLTPGTHTVTFKYTPRGFVAGMIISIVCILILVFLFLRRRITDFMRDKNLLPQKKLPPDIDQQ